MLSAAGLALSCAAADRTPHHGPGCTGLPRSESCGVLFFGNSYTFANDLPSVLEHLADSAGKQVETAHRTPGGETLAGHAAAPDTRQLLRDKTWNVVILQDQSQAPALESIRQTEMYPAARTLAHEARRVHALPMLFLTWAHATGWPEQGLPTYARMQSAIDVGYLNIAHELNAPIAPVGIAWWEAVRSRPPLELWAEDGSHPTVAGTYLAACVIYAAIFHATPEGLPYHDALPASVASRLQRIAATVVLRDPTLWSL
jgi:hypothetical protein